MKKTLTGYARNLRNNPTYVETILWEQLRARQLDGIKFRRQAPIERFIVDFVSFESRVIIELDGGQHAESTVADRERDRIFGESGFTVLRFWNNDVLENLEGMLEVIRCACLK